VLHATWPAPRGTPPKLSPIGGQFHKSQSKPQQSPLRAIFF
jgi:hypothetical protein